MARNSRFKCMKCNRPPQWEVMWADGRARAWFCGRHMKQWEREDGDILRKRQVDGVVGVKWSDPVQRPPLKGFVKEAYDERKHKRAPKGSSKGGQFAKGIRGWLGKKEKPDGAPKRRKIDAPSGLPNVKTKIYPQYKKKVIARLKEFRIDVGDIESAFNFKGLESEIRLSGADSADGSAFLSVECYLQDSKENEVGSLQFTLDNVGGTLFGHMAIGFQAQGKGVGRKAVDGLIGLTRAAGLKTISLHADISIGPYAWARMGFDFKKRPSRLEDDFGGWAIQHDIDPPEGGWPEKFESAKALADYDPGITVKGDQIENEDVNPDANLHLGKAYMLDKGGIGSWDAVLHV